jgi:hypothetical protein
VCQATGWGTEVHPLEAWSQVSLTANVSAAQLICAVLSCLVVTLRLAGLSLWRCCTRTTSWQVCEARRVVGVMEPDSLRLTAAG